MKPVIKYIVRWGAYPIIFGGCALALLAATSNHLPYWPLVPLISGLGMACVALLEHLQPYEPAWLSDHGDTGVDILHALVSLTLIFLTAESASFLVQFLPVASLWPTRWPTWAQVLLAGAIIDFGLWSMHRASHSNVRLWKLHAIHHSAERLYWLNGERRHPLSALVLGAPGITVAVFAGAPPEIIGCWLAIVAVHLAFQHANVDYSVGILRQVLCVAEIHRWHHKRDYEDAQVNFGEFWLIWDHLFGTFHHERQGVRAGEVGLRDETAPMSYLGQLAWPWRT
ncbi:sterol desaturase family protein [Massilia sp. CCM 8695]|uniref:Sterol desaturase family protein n=1 Tax=Massilia frigida TaxID=2609281 RepID=A0ABX0NEZ7_9BURK|nr:sterol desaturase family protein [Massilia frigida]NHZ83694.1 sterol desaturase family protein [Massilia frigida]